MRVGTLETTHGLPLNRVGLGLPVVALAGSALIAVSAHVALPLWMTGVPFTLQPLAILALALMMGPRAMVATILAYLAEGAAGLPVFSPAAGPAGFAHLIGPTGGYLLAWAFAAPALSWIARKADGGYLKNFVFAACADFAVLIAGAVWLSVYTHKFSAAAVAIPVAALLPGDVVKAALAAGVAQLKRARSNRV